MNKHPKQKFLKISASVIQDRENVMYGNLLGCYLSACILWCYFSKWYSTKLFIFLNAVMKHLTGHSLSYRPFLISYYCQASFDVFSLISDFQMQHYFIKAAFHSFTLFLIFCYSLCIVNFHLCALHLLYYTEIIKRINFSFPKFKECIGVKGKRSSFLYIHILKDSS